MKVGTLNIRCIAPEDGKNHWVFRSKYVKQYIVDHGYDIITLQEVTLPQLIDLKLLFLNTNYKFIYYHNSLFSGYNYIVILYDKSKYELMHSKRIWLSPTPYKYNSKFEGMINPRIAISGVFKTKNEYYSRYFVFGGTHFDHAGDGRRRDCAYVLCKWLKQMSVNHALPSIIGGDFNGTNKDDFYQIMLDNEYVDFDTQNLPTFHGFSGKPFSKIDYLFCNGDITNNGFGVDKDRLDQTPKLSDHCPVWCEISL